MSKKIFGLINHPHTKKEHPSGALSYARQRPTLTGGQPPTTIGAEKLNFRVRYGNGCGLLAIAARHLFK